MDDDVRKTRIATEMEMARRELERRSQDTIRIYNPLDHSFRYMRNRYWYTVPAKSYKDIPRYLADHYFKKIAEYMINQQIATEGAKLKALREKQMGHVYRDSYEENVEVWDRVPKLNDADLLRKVKEVVIIGLVEEYGLAEAEPDTRIPEEVVDFRTPQERILAENDRRVEGALPPSAPLSAPSVDEVEAMMKDPSRSNKKPSVEEVSVE